MKPSKYSIWKHFIKSLPLTLVAMALTAVAVLAATGTTDSAAVPGSTSSYTLEDLYQRLVSGTTGIQSTFSEPSSAPGMGTMHDINALMAAAPMRDDANGATTADVLPGTTFWGLTNGEWGQQTGSMPLGSDVTGADGSISFTIPDGYYSGSTATAQDSDLVPENIAYGVTIFGVLGSHYTRFIDNGDGTVTDDFNGMMWTQNGNLPDGKLDWNAGVAFCDVLSLAGYDDWRLASNDDFNILTTGEQSFSVSTPRVFTNYKSAHYWTSTSGYYYMFHLATFGIQYTNWPNFTEYIWCTRDV